ncbi:MAG: VanW family protein [Turicibacter sp.]|nr:VanW family protein [Turicibacter sp.]
MGKTGMITFLVSFLMVIGGVGPASWQGAVVLAGETEAPLKATITLGGKDITNANREEIKAAVTKALKTQRGRLVKICCGTRVFETSRYELGLELAEDMDAIIDGVEMFRASILLLEKSTGEVPAIYECPLPLKYRDGVVDKWIREIKQKMDDPMAENSIALKDGQFVEQPGHPGKEISREYIKKQLRKTILDHGTGPIAIEVQQKEVFPRRDLESLKSINSRIAGFSSYYPLYQAGRTQNVRIAAKRIDKTILMPGDEFSYAEQVSPVNVASGYQYATIFMNGQPVSGIGGGICQVSSTIYNAQLKAGIKATKRMNHSLIVDYVPRGQDATMAEGFIDYRFVNTLDYPIYIHASTNGGTLLIEFWSNEEALNGITYLPRTVFKGLTEQGFRKYDTTLYGYNKDGELVYEEFLHRSLYKQKN